jgi:hypothetical protein
MRTEAVDVHIVGSDDVRNGSSGAADAFGRHGERDEGRDVVQQRLIRLGAVAAEQVFDRHTEGRDAPLNRIKGTAPASLSGEPRRDAHEFLSSLSEQH